LGGFAHIHSAFDERALMLTSCESGNTIAFACDGEPVSISLNDLKEAALALKAETGLNLLPTLTRLAQGGTCANNTLIL
jgi:hypothetical protein